MPESPTAHEHPPLSQVVLVTGKGGVGKTTLAAGFAESARRRSGDAALVEFGDGESGRRALGLGSRVRHEVVKPAEAIEDMASTLFGSAILSKVVTGNFAMKRLLRAGPALRELGQLEAVRRMAAQRPGTRIVVDMPATGHGVAWLRVPTQMSNLVKSGPLHDLSARLSKELLEKGRVSTVIVSLPEKLVLRETLELCHAVQEDVGLKPSRMIINRVPKPLPSHALSEAMRLVRRGGPVGHAAQRLVELVAARDQARGEARAALQQATEALSVTPVILPAAPVDPTATQVADWLDAEGAA